MKKTISILLTLLLCTLLFAPCAAADDTIPEGYTPVYTTEDLDNIRLNMEGKYILMNDIRFTDADYEKGGDFYNSGKGWSPIGTTTKPFNGELNGNGYGIYNLKINAPSDNNTGLFGYTKSLTVSNLTLQGDVSGKSSCALLCGFCIRGALNINDVSLYGSAAASSGACGGVCGRVSATSNKWSCSISNTIVDGNVKGSSSVGGLIGQIDSCLSFQNNILINNCRFHGTVEGVESGYVGGIIGKLYVSLKTEATITRCLVEGEVSTTSGSAGGIIGDFSGESDIVEDTPGSSVINVSYCENQASITGTSAAGGIVGTCKSHWNGYWSSSSGGYTAISFRYMNIFDCMNRGEITATSTSGMAGGIAAAFNSNALTGSENNYNSKIQRCYNTGVITGNKKGGITAGADRTGDRTQYSLPAASPSYYLDTCVENPTNTEGNAKSEDQLRKQSTFENWDFETVWQIDKTADYKFPTLRAIAALPEIEQPDACTHENAYLRGAADATCTENGYTGDRYCPDCDTVLETGAVITAPGHAIVEHTAQAPTCVSAGWDAYETCENCDYTTYVEKPATGAHTPGEPTETVLTAATCGKAGEKKITVKCSVCGETLSETTEPIPATGKHTAGAPVETVLTAATCAKAGEKKITVKCSVCGETLSETTEPIPANGNHTPGAAVVTILREPTCAQAGLRVTTVTCTVCGKNLSEKETAIGKLPHTDADNDGVCDDCKQEIPTAAQEEGERCKYCDAIHPNTFFGKLTAFFHNILYFFAHLFGKR